MKKFLTLQLIIAFLCIAMFGGAAESHEVSLSWALPTHTVLNGDCLAAGYPIPIDKEIEVTVRVKKQGDATWVEQEAGIGTTEFTVTGLAPETTYELSVGPHYIGVPVLCYSPSVLATTPSLEPPQGCTSVTVTNVQ